MRHLGEKRKESTSLVERFNSDRSVDYSWVASAPGHKPSSIGTSVSPSLGLDGSVILGFQARRRYRTSTTTAKTAVALASVFWSNESARSLARPPGQVSKLSPAGDMQYTGFRSSAIRQTFGFC